MRRCVHFLFGIAAAGAVLALLHGARADDDRAGDPFPPPTYRGALARQACVDCHAKLNPGIQAAWAASAHARRDVSCADCHGLDHSTIFGRKGAVAVQVCAGCHAREAAEFETSGHAAAWDSMASHPRFAAETPAGRAACIACHRVGEPDPQGGPRGRCNFCHVGHDLSPAEAREPAACTGCHQGADHPQAEAYAASKHGIAYAATHDPARAPTCATCHMPDGGHGRDPAIGLGTTFAGRRLASDPAPPFPMPALTAEEQRAARAAAIARCAACHAARFATESLAWADEVKRECDATLARAAASVLEARRAEGAAAPSLGPAQVPEQGGPLERQFFLLWKSLAPAAWKGAYHQSGAWAHAEGLVKLRAGAIALEEDAARRVAAARAAMPPEKKEPDR
jgi:hypothetical protein